MNIILLGAPGSGKGTLAKQIVSELKLVHISTGDLLREAVKNSTALGKQAKSFMDAGKLVPDTLIIDLMEERFKQPDCQKGFILDGFPRTVPQAEALEKLLVKMHSQIDSIIHLEVGIEEVVKRMAGRLNCAQCGSVFHKTNLPPKKAGICDKCGAALYQRDDDKEETVRKRFNVYLDQTKPLIDFYNKSGKLVTIDGSISPKQTLDKTLKVLVV